METRNLSGTAIVLTDLTTARLGVGDLELGASPVEGVLLVHLGELVLVRRGHLD